ncbi:MAG: aminoacyl-tRNA hydrolase [Patescibacteria group bacterium]|nr:aminoacyl-tRNA hydrolase [Patescibacteria group bacterium]
MKLIIGLGNPGPDYKNTRHNVGFRLLDELMIHGLFDLSEFKTEKKFNAEVSEGTFGAEKIILAKPTTFMNDSGAAVLALKTFYKIKSSEIIVIQDDLDLPIGKIRISTESSSAGHKGIDSIIQKLKSKTFIRIRVGIANELKEIIPADKFVLQKFSEEDEEILEGIIPDTIEAIKMFCENEPLEKIQSKLN